MPVVSVGRSIREAIDRFVTDDAPAAAAAAG